MFELGFSLASQLKQSADKAWNYVSHFACLAWFKFNHLRYPIMPRSRRRHHSRTKSRSRSRSHSHERDRDAKRRKIDIYDSPHHNHKRSVSEDRVEIIEVLSNSSEDEIESTEVVNGEDDNSPEKDVKQKVVSEKKSDKTKHIPDEKGESNSGDEEEERSTSATADEAERKEEIADMTDMECNDPTDEKDETNSDDREEEEGDSNEENSKMTKLDSSDSPADKKATPLKKTPKKSLTPKQLQKKLESEKKRQERQKEKEERERKRLEEKERIRIEKLKEKQEREEKKQKEIEQKQKEKEMKEEQKRKELEQKQKEKELKEEQKRKEKEEKEQRKKEREEREEQRKKEKELERLKKQQEIDEKNKERQKLEQKMQKSSAAFVNFFLPKKVDEEKKPVEEKKHALFKGFEVKSDMRLAPSHRKLLTEDEKKHLVKSINTSSSKSTYLADIKDGKSVGKCGRTWPFEESEEDCTVVEDGVDLGETISEDEVKPTKMRAKFLMFHENRRPAYFGTWRKKSKSVNPRKPFAQDTEVFNYEEDSDDDWEDEEQGESLDDSDGEDKETETTNDDYEVDNEFFVPHGHLSDDEVDDEATTRLSPESHKQKLKLLKDEFDMDRQSKTNKLKPRFVGCIWFDKHGKHVDAAIDSYLRPFSMITDGIIVVEKRADLTKGSSNKAENKIEGHVKDLDAKLIPEFIKMVHGNCSNRKALVADFITFMNNNGYEVNISKASLSRNVKQVAFWTKCPEAGPMHNKFCWYVPEDVRKKYNLELTMSNPN